jgi:hypothetical protein
MPPSRQRSQRVLKLATRLDSIYDKISGIVEATVDRRQYMTYLIKSNEVVIGCPRTLVYRAVSSSENHADFEIDHRCLMAARSTLRCHQDMIIHIQDRKDGSANDYANWTILNCPFTPFIVLFCHVIASFDLDDLKLMEAFTIFLEGLNLKTATSMINFRVLCEAFLLLATRYIRMSTRQPQALALFGNQQTDSMHVTPSSGLNKGHEINFPNDGFSFLPQGIFEEWLSGNQGFNQHEFNI